MLLLVINVILLFVGSVLEPPAAILMLTPLLTPIAYAAGVDPIHFGIIVTVNLGDRHVHAAVRPEPVRRTPCSGRRCRSSTAACCRSW